MTEPSYLSATREAYDTVAADYALHPNSSLAGRPLDRALLAAFAELVQAAGPVADIGCGPGHVTAHLRSLGLSPFGIDLSPAMVAVARRTHQDLRFEQGSMTALDLPDGGLRGIVARYSIIHLPPDQLPLAFSEFHRTLDRGGHLLLAFQVGDERIHVQHAYGHAVSADAYRLLPDRIADLLTLAGFTVIARLLREPDHAEKVPIANLLARKLA